LSDTTTTNKIRRRTPYIQKVLNGKAVSESFVTPPETWDLDVSQNPEITWVINIDNATGTISFSVRGTDASGKDKSWTGSFTDTLGLLNIYRYPVGLASKGDGSDLKLTYFKSIRLDYEEYATSASSDVFSDDFMGYKTNTSCILSVPDTSVITIDDKRWFNGTATVLAEGNDYQWISSSVYKGQASNIQTSFRGAYIDPDSGFVIKPVGSNDFTGVNLSFKSKKIESINHLRFTTVNSQVTAVRLAVNDTENSYFEFGVTRYDDNPNNDPPAGVTDQYRSQTPYVATVVNGVRTIHTVDTGKWALGTGRTQNWLVDIDNQTGTIYFML